MSRERWGIRRAGARGGRDMTTLAERMGGRCATARGGRMGDHRVATRGEQSESRDTKEGREGFAPALERAWRLGLLAAALALSALPAAAQTLRCVFPVACLDDRGCVHQRLRVEVAAGGDRAEVSLPALSFEAFAAFDPDTGLRSFVSGVEPGPSGAAVHMLTVFADGSARFTTHGPRPGSPVAARGDGFARTDLGACEER